MKCVQKKPLAVAGVAKLLPVKHNWKITTKDTKAKRTTVLKLHYLIKLY